MARTDRLWNNPIRQEWEKVLNEDYWKVPSVQQTLPVERYFHHLHQEQVENMDATAWRELLEKYATWQFGPRNAIQNFKPIAKLSPEAILEIRNQLLAFDKDDIARGLEIIPAWQVPGKSGLLAVLFPEHFGTVGRYVVYSLQHLCPSIFDYDVSRINAEQIKTDECCRVIKIMRTKADQLNEAFGFEKDAKASCINNCFMSLW